MIDNAHQLTEPWAAYPLIDESGGWMVAYVEKDKPGYWPTTYTFTGDGEGRKAAQATARSINEAKGLSRSEALDIVSSSIAASNKEQG